MTKKEEQSHKDIMSLWWKCDFLEEGSGWQRVLAYSTFDPAGRKYCVMDEWRTKEWFTGRESSSLPPE